MDFSAVLKCAVLAILAFVWPLAAADPVWFEVTSPNFILFTDTNEAKGRRLLVDLESRVSELADVLEGIPPRQHRVEVFLFKESADFLQGAPRNPDGTELEKAAYLLRGPDRIFVVARDKSPEDIVRDAGHALGHVFHERSAWWRPFWLAEGAAEYFRKIGQNPDNKKVSERDKYAASDLLAIVPSATYKDDDEVSSPFRLQSHRLFRILLEEHRRELRDFLQTLDTAEGKDAKPKVDTAALDAALNRYAEKRITPATVPVVDARQIPSATVAIHRGDLLAAADRTSEASDWYNGDSAEARAARAIMTRFSRSGSEPFQALEQASKEFPDNGLVQFHFGSIEVADVTALANQARALERAVELLPRSGRVHGQLARVHTLTGDGEAALAQVDLALAKEPEYADEFLLRRADAYLALSNFEEAVKAAELALASPHLVRGARYEDKLAELNNRIREIRRLADSQRLEQIRADVAVAVSQRDLPPVPPPLPPPQKFGDIRYEVQARVPIQILNAPLPRYNDTLIQSGSAGNIILQVRVGADGRVADASIVSSQLTPMNVATLDAVKRWMFSPSASGGKGVPFDVRVTVRFIVQEAQ